MNIFGRPKRIIWICFFLNILSIGKYFWGFRTIPFFVRLTGTDSSQNTATLILLFPLRA